MQKTDKTETIRKENSSSSSPSKTDGQQQRQSAVEAAAAVATTTALAYEKRKVTRFNKILNKHFLGQAN